MARTEYSSRSSGVMVMIQGIAEKTTLSPRDVYTLYRGGRLSEIFGADGKIPPEFRRRMSGAEARAKLRSERKPDGSPRKRCPMCNDPYDDDYRCYCNRRKPAEDRDPRYETIHIRREP